MNIPENGRSASNKYGMKSITTENKGNVIDVERVVLLYLGWVFVFNVAWQLVGYLKY